MENDTSLKPWLTEPNRVEFEHAGLPCLMLRGPLLAWCGYVAVPPTHPWYRFSHNDVDVQVHGGLTYTDKCHGEICHVPKPGEPDDVWWFGFDCAHAYDLAPKMQELFEGFGMKLDRDETYRDMAYVRAEVESLAEQLAKVR